MEESWTLFSAILGVGEIPYISRIHTAYIGEDSLHFRYLKCSVIQLYVGRDYFVIGELNDIRGREGTFMAIVNLPPPQTPRNPPRLIRV